MGEALDEIEGLNKFETLIIGDFNADYLDKKGKPYQIIKRFEAEHQVQQMIKEATRYSNNNHTTIDLAFTNMKYCTGAGVINYNISDHKAIYVVKKKARNCKATEVHIGRSYNKMTNERLQEVIGGLDNSLVYEADEPNLCWKELEKLITRVANRICPVKELRVRTHTVEY